MNHHTWSCVGELRIPSNLNMKGKTTESALYYVPYYHQVGAKAVSALLVSDFLLFSFWPNSTKISFLSRRFHNKQTHTSDFVSCLHSTIVLLPPMISLPLSRSWRVNASTFLCFEKGRFSRFFFAWRSVTLLWHGDNFCTCRWMEQMEDHLSHLEGVRSIEMDGGASHIWAVEKACWPQSLFGAHSVPGTPPK